MFSIYQGSWSAHDNDTVLFSKLFFRLERLLKYMFAPKRYEHLQKAQVV